MTLILSSSKNSVLLPWLSGFCPGCNGSKDCALGTVDCAGGVCTVSAGARIGPGNGWKSSRGVSSNVHTSRGRVRAVATIAGVPVPGVAEAGISVAWVAAISQNVGISLSFPLGDMDNSSRVGDVTPSTSINSSDSRDGSRGSSKGGERGRGRDTGIAGSSVGKRVAVTSIAGIAGVAKTVVAKQVWVSLSADRCSKEKGRLKECITF